MSPCASSSSPFAASMTSDAHVYDSGDAGSTWSPVASPPVSSIGFNEALNAEKRLVPPAGIEPATPGLGNLCSIH